MKLMKQEKRFITPVALSVAAVLAVAGAIFHNHVYQDPGSFKSSPETEQTEPFPIVEVLKVEKKGSELYPHKGDIVTVHYEGRFENGERFDSSYERNSPLQYKYGTGCVIRGFDMALAQIGEGGKMTVKIPPDLAYGKRGAGGVIPPNSSLIFDLELMKVEK